MKQAISGRVDGNTKRNSGEGSALKDSACSWIRDNHLITRTLSSATSSLRQGSQFVVNSSAVKEFYETRRKFKKEEVTLPDMGKRCFELSLLFSICVRGHEYPDRVPPLHSWSSFSKFRSSCFVSNCPQGSENQPTSS